MLAEVGTAVNRGAYPRSSRRMRRLVSHLGPASEDQSVLAPSVPATAVAWDVPWGEIREFFDDYHIPEVLRQPLKDTVPKI
jgi:hypothetical protein